MKALPKKNQIQAPKGFIPDRAKVIQFWGEEPGGDEGGTWCSCCLVKNQPVSHVGLPNANMHVAFCNACLSRLQQAMPATKLPPIREERIIPTRKRGGA